MVQKQQASPVIDFGLASLPQEILVSDWSISKKIFNSETAYPNELKLERFCIKFHQSRMKGERQTLRPLRPLVLGVLIQFSLIMKNIAYF